MPDTSATTPRFFCLAGPTACGKTALAIEVAGRCNAEIVGADAFQVYSGLDILTAKPSMEELERVPHHLVGVAPLTAAFDVAQFRKRAIEAIQDISARGKLPLLVGGTGLYFRSLTHGLADLPSANPELRAELEQLQLPALQERYTQLDPVGAKRIDLKNPRRLIRAIEVCEISGKPFSSFHDPAPPGADACDGVFVFRAREELYARIDARTRAMFDAGVVGEVRAVGAISETARQAIGFREIQALIAGRIKQEECITAIQQATRRYAKRQLTWFRGQTSFQHLDLSTLPDFSSAVKTVARAAASLADLQDV
jgi:tRNA dimethylallyltransferase